MNDLWSNMHCSLQLKCYAPFLFYISFRAKRTIVTHIKWIQLKDIISFPFWNMIRMRLQITSPAGVCEPLAEDNMLQHKLNHSFHMWRATICISDNTALRDLRSWGYWSCSLWALFTRTITRFLTSSLLTGASFPRNTALYASISSESCF